MKYGVTSDYVLGLDVVLADGTLVTLGGPRIKDVAGLSLLQLFVGSEGTLGVVTRAILRLEPAQTVGATMVAAFPTMTAAAEAVVAIRRRLRPSMLELMDQPSIRAVEAFRPMGLDTDAGALLVAQSDAPGTACGVEVEAMRAACEAAGSTDVFVTEDADEGELFVQARRLVVPAVEPLGELMLEDVGVPVPRLPELVDAVATGSRPGTTCSSRWSRTPGTATPTRSSWCRGATTTPGCGRWPPSTRSCTRPSAWAAPSPASTAWAAPRRRHCPPSSATTSWR